MLGHTWHQKYSIRCLDGYHTITLDAEGQSLTLRSSKNGGYICIFECLKDIWQRYNTYTRRYDGIIRCTRKVQNCRWHQYWRVLLSYLGLPCSLYTKSISLKSNFAETHHHQEGSGRPTIISHTLSPFPPNRLEEGRYRKPITTTTLQLSSVESADRLSWRLATRLWRI